MSGSRKRTCHRSVLPHFARRGTRRAGRIVLLAAVLLSVSGCSGMSFRKELESIGAGQEPADEKVTQVELQADLMAFADEYLTAVAQTADEFMARAKTPRERAEVLAWKVWQSTGAVTKASSGPPAAGLMDMVAMVVLSRTAVEKTWIPRLYSNEPAAASERYRALEEKVWKLSEKILDPDQQEELRQLIETLRTKRVTLQDASLVRLTNVVKDVGGGVQDTDTGPRSILGLLYMDPLANLDPTTRELEQMRYLADRAMFQFQRMPMLLGWEMEWLTQQLVGVPEIKSLLAETARVREAVSRAARTAERLPKFLRQERQSLTRDLIEQEPRFRSLLQELHETIEATDHMAQSVGKTVTVLDDFIAQFEPPASAKGASGGAEAAEPLDVAEFGVVAERVGQTAGEIEKLVHSLQSATPQAQTFLLQTADEGKELMDHAFRLALLLVAAVVGGFVCVFLAYRLVFAARR